MIKGTGLNRTEREIIKALANNDMKVSLAAKEVYMSRSSVTYNIGKIMKKTRLNPLCFYELVELLKEVRGEVVR